MSCPAFAWALAQGAALDLLPSDRLVLIYLAVFKEMEPVLLLPIGFGCLLANIPLAGMTAAEGMMGVLYKAGIATELFPLSWPYGLDFHSIRPQPLA